MGRTTPEMPLSVQQALDKLGRDIRNARKRRRITTRVMADRAGISRPTLRRVEQGDPSVALGIYASVLFVLGMADHLEGLADVTRDTRGLELQQEELPERVSS